MWYYRGRMGENSPPDGSCLQFCRASTVCEPHCEIQQRCSHFNILFQKIYLFLYYSQRMCACVPVCHGFCVEDTDNLWPQFYFIFSFYHTDAGNAPQATRSGPSPAEPSHLLPHIFRPVPTNSRTGRNSEHILTYKSCVLSSNAFWTPQATPQTLMGPESLQVSW